MGKTEIKDDLKLIMFNPGKAYTATSIKHYISSVSKHPVNAMAYKRFIVLSDISPVNIPPYEIENMVSIIKKFRSFKSDADTCFYCKDCDIETIARIFIEKLKPEFKNTYVSKDLDACADYLKIDEGVLKEF